MDEIRIEGLRFFAYHGVYEKEKRKGQEFIINAVLYTDTRKAGLKDDLNLSTDYSKVCETIKNVVTENNYNLIETVAEKIAEAVLSEYGSIKAVDVEVCKPQAPVHETFKSISVKIHRAWHDVYISYGSNMGDSMKIIDNAFESIKKNERIRLISGSKRIVTKPYGYTDQEDFINGAFRIETLYGPEELLDYLGSLEQDAGRVREIHWGPRTLDLDILLYDDLVMSTERLTIPHVDMQNRQFVLEPMCEIAPWLRHPLLGKTMTEMLNSL
jgi:dihydroneopterin aldolase/2-amino-4-hydroxy-6-hydroxymethyldihydropteridine diphosphokinase